MHYRLRYLSFTTATLLLSVTFPLLPLTSNFEPLVVQAQTTQDRTAEAKRLNQEGLQQLDRGQFREGLEKFQQALAINQEIGDRKGEGVILNNIGRVYDSLGQYPKALEFYQQALAIRKEVGDKAGEGTTLNNIGAVYNYLGQYPKALEFYQQALAIRKEVGDRGGEGTTLSNIGTVYNYLGQYPKALEFYQQALAISKDIGDKPGEGTILNNIGLVYKNLGQYPKALEFYQQALAIRKDTGGKAGEGTTLNNIGQVYDSLGQYPKALEFYQQALAISKDIGDKAGEGNTLNSIGTVYNYLGQYPKALEFYQQALAISKDIGDKAGEGDTFNNIGAVYNYLGQYPKALEFYQQALAIRSRIGDKAGEGTTLNNIGAVYVELGQYLKALEFYQQALAIRGDVGDKPGEGTTLNNIGLVYKNLGQYPKALEFYQQALAISKDIGDKAGEGTTLSNIGQVYKNLGQYPKALEFYQQALAISKDIGDKAGEGTTLNNIGSVYDSLGQYPKALEFYQEALAISKDIGDKAGEGRTLNNIGAFYHYLGQYPKALELYQQALAIRSRIGDKGGEGTTLNNIGAVYKYLGQYPKALEFYQQALAIVKEIGDKPGEGVTLNNIGFLLEEQKQPQLAIAFLKQSVNVTEAIRKDLRSLPKEQQQSYTETVAATYRRLADLLLKENRVLEAQRVLDLLKVQELDDYLRTVQGNENTKPGVEYLPLEERLLGEYNTELASVVQIGKELQKLQKIPASDRTPQQEQRRRQIETAQRESTRKFLDFIGSPQIVTLVGQLNQTTGSENLSPQMLVGLQDNLKKLAQDAVLLYPLILEDRLELVLITPYAPPIHQTVPVKREELNRTIVDFRSALKNPNANAKEPAQKLYNWLIQPIEAALKEANAQTIIYAPDGQLRYIPLAALYDGNQWLVQKYRVNNITALSLIEWDKKPQAPKILAGAFSQGNYSFQVGDRNFNFGGLRFAGKEVENLAAMLPNTTGLLNRDFSEKEILARISDYSILHFATHAAFVTGKPEDSFILFGNGDRANFRDVETWPLKNTDLVVLSACETGVGGQLGDGKEILGFGYLMQKAGARAAIASLWTVDDGGTQALMNAFYTALENGNTPKAESLRQAQIALITGDYTALGQERGIFVVERIRDIPGNVSDRLSHPYYWAPFILIGNGL
ncbi:tetratricopeptide repeat protein [Coleofasciculus sp. FACHB-SPT9]|uniref:tetratricopeptide repeat protein n=1 Tax=Cyanophyceae TaxID=3028117 RepID=UPI001689172D|nr:tetratricopeptide repeat protein [Coleofasciculus sp. FACHB-SPT9]MBD1892553.1 tetratricopeptide repeat protein [Coleofasciculus sp. FACHB-SPT9]